MTWIEDARAITQGATPGPWRHATEFVPDARHDVLASGAFVVAELLDGEGPDARFIAMARNVMPAMLDALEAAEERLHCRSCAMCDTDPPLRAALDRVRQRLGDGA